MTDFDPDDLPEDAVISDYYPRAASGLYLVVIAFGVGATFFVAYTGFYAWPPIPSILTGGALILATRILKRWIRPILWREGGIPSESAPQTKVLPTTAMAIAFGYVVMGVVACFWYLMGAGARWLFS